MKIFRAANEVRSSGRTTCLAIGFFDGVHRGHQEIIRRTCDRAKRHGGASVVLTFDPHPAQIIAPKTAPRLIYPLSHRLRTISLCGPDGLLLLRFDRRFSEQTGAEFIRSLASELGGLRSICVGSNFHFGRQRSGNVALLQTLGLELGFEVEPVEVLSSDGASISSTRIREAISAGNFALAEALLGRPYELIGPVVRGDGLGRKLGFPTANIEVAGLVLPPAGVYAVQAVVGNIESPAVLNIGCRPTLAQASPVLRIEAHIPGLNENLYDREMRLRINRRLRDERKFGSLEDLRDQIAADVREAMGTQPPGARL